MRRLILLPCLVVCLVVISCAGSASGQYHEDNNWGFKVKVPGGWKKIPLKVTERWIIGKYLCNRSYVGEASWPQKPQMQIIVFPEEAKKKGKDKPKKTGEDQDTESFEIKFKYKTYPDWLKSNFSGGGWFFSLEEEGEVAGIKVSRYEAKVEKLVNQKLRIIAWVFHLPDCDVAVSFDVLEVRYKKLKGAVYGALKSFRLAERTTQNPMQKTGSEIVTTKKKWKDMSPIERMKHRKKLVDRHLERAKAELPEGWKIKKSPRFVAFTHVDSKHTKRVLNQAEAIRGWLDKHLYDVGEGYVPRCVIRICLNADERAAFVRGSFDSYFSVIGYEIVLAKHGVWSQRDEMETLSTSICNFWFRAKNSELYYDLPPWIGRGIRQYIGTALCKGKKLVFKPDTWEQRHLREGRREGKLVKCRDIIKMTGAEWTKQYRSSGQSLIAQASSIFRYLLSSKCRRHKLTKGVIPAYFRNLEEVVAEVKKKEKKSEKNDKQAETEEEEAAQAKASREAAKKRARHVMDETFRRTFGTWSEKDWEKFEKGWAKACL